MTKTARLTDIRITPGGVHHIRLALVAKGYSESQIESALWLWHAEHARRPEMSPDMWKRIETRLEGPSGAPGLELVYDTNMMALSFVTDSQPVPRSVRLRSASTLNDAQHHDELEAMDTLERFVDQKGNETIERTHRAASLASRALAGNPDALSRLGVTILDRAVFPVAHEQAGVQRDPDSGVLRRKEVVELPPAAGFDVVAYFERLRLDRRIPLASTEAVRRFVMLLASPLLRVVCTGLLGIYWLQGPSGAGKDFLATLARQIWERVGIPGARAAMELQGGKDGTEDRKTLATAPGAIFALAREAGKHGADFLGHFIRKSGSATISVRGNYRDEVELPNRLTFMADSAELIPDRREISRRTVRIEVARIEEGFPSVAVREDVLALAALIIASLKAMVEAARVDLRDVVSADGRPHAQAVLSALFGATLDPVVGESLADIFEAMWWFVYHQKGTRRACTPNSAKIAHAHPNYDAAEFIETMQNEVGYRELFRTLRHATNLERRIRRELAYDAALKKADYLDVDVSGRPCGFRFTSQRPLRFIFFPVGATPPVPTTGLGFRHRGP